MGMELAHGGHLTHGSPVNFTGKMFNVVSYGVRQSDELIDYDEVGDISCRAAQGDHRRSDRVFAALGLQSSEGHRRRGRSGSNRRCGSLRGSRCGGSARQSGRVRRRRHLHHAQNSPRSPRRRRSCVHEEHAKAIDKSVFPGWQGGPLMHSIAAKAVA